MGAYEASFWPQDFVQSCCKLVGPATLSDEFGGKYWDGSSGVEYSCMLQQSKQVVIQPSVFVRNGTIIRWMLQKMAPAWNPQVWDIMDQQALPDLAEDFMRPPAWLMGLQ